MCHGLGNVWIEAREAEKNVLHHTVCERAGPQSSGTAEEVAQRPGPGVCLQQIGITNGLIVTSV